MTTLRMLATLLLLLASNAAFAARSFSLEPAHPEAGKPVSLRVDDTGGCYEFDDQQVARAGNAVTVQILVSDHVITPCPSNLVTPLWFPLGTFVAGSYTVDVQECGALPLNPCTTHTLLALEVDGTPARRATIPTLGVTALLLSCSGILALAFIGRRGGSRR